jgi:hypothetical protein
MPELDIAAICNTGRPNLDKSYKSESSWGIKLTLSLILCCGHHIASHVTQALPDTSMWFFYTISQRRPSKMSVLYANRAVASFLELGQNKHHARYPRTFLTFIFIISVSSVEFCKLINYTIYAVRGILMPIFIPSVPRNLFETSPFLVF